MTRPDYSPEELRRRLTICNVAGVFCLVVMLAVVVLNGHALWQGTWKSELVRGPLVSSTIFVMALPNWLRLRARVRALDMGSAPAPGDAGA